MKLAEFYRCVIKFGSSRDPRGHKISEYQDTAILYGDGQATVKKLLVGVDIESAELLLAERIRQREGLDLVIGHHPEGRAYAHLHEVMILQAELLKKAGLKDSVAKNLLEERINEVHRRIMPANHMRAVDAARLLDIPFICMHTPADNHVSDFLERLFRKERPAKVADLLDLLSAIPEYKIAQSSLNAGPRLILGNPGRKAGKIILEMTGGTEGNKEAYPRLYKSGVRTVVCMHMSEEHFKKAKEAGLNVIIAGHISSDVLGMNLLLDNIEKQAGESFEVIGCSGFTRVKRSGNGRQDPRECA